MTQKIVFLLALRIERWYTINGFSSVLEKWNDFLWSGPTLILILGTAVSITIFCGAPQVRLFLDALRQFCKNLHPKGKSEKSSYRALCTALAATVGTGNIAGVAGAITIGGPGAIFWMWISAFLGMAVKYGESTLAVRFRVREPGGGFRGGSMYIIENGLDPAWRFLGTLYCVFGLIAAFGVGNATQINAVISALREAGQGYGYSVSPAAGLFAGILLGILVVVLVSGGAEKIGAAAELLVPVAAGAYILVCLWVLWLRREYLPAALHEIFTGAFSPAGITGGAVGSGFVALRIGVSRGVFTNEAGMGTAAMAHGGAEVACPAEQGLMGIMEVFLDTVVICTMTGLVILTADFPIPYGENAGAELTARALSRELGPWAGAFVCACLSLFAVATVLGWGLYAGRCAQYLMGSMNWKVFALCQGGCVLLGAGLESDLIWSLSETMNALMALPNLIALQLLLPELRHLTYNYYKKTKHGRKAAGGTYENIH